MTIPIGRRGFIAGVGCVGIAAALSGAAWAEKQENLRSVKSLKAGKAQLDPVTLQLSGPSGANTSLEAQRGKPFLLHVWATWCGPCKQELPKLDAFMASLGTDCPIIPVAVASATPEKVAAFLDAAGLKHIPAWTVDKAAYKAWLKTSDVAIPVTYLIDGSGRLRASAEGGVNWSAPDAAQQLHDIFAEL
ncbi:TlpA disulfide reductase family protein [Gluconobacter japonicus]|uniref:TlpA disulfide reductase family protein n=1 Tax=Gluconobacter japonicus TaxID=376620 RepID=UPI0007821FFF|nr:TlpA disulfide reductase family protein [Gluconobacter japonicus]KXV21170.1 thiol:disulfide interchange protein [Gluconobacter japonicus]